MLIRRNVLVLMVGLYACLAVSATIPACPFVNLSMVRKTAIALCPAPTFARTIGIGAILLLLFPVVVLAVAWSKVDNGPLKNWHTITGSARPPWHTRLWQGSESRLHRPLVSRPSNTFPTTVADFV
ncbi:hypothetical protein BD779DRAFT_1532272 [Infundibulicybe gibba]|nr:hypothetical protein BD779DRAFT_1532272 [Infundibulicybe gibba]